MTEDKDMFRSKTSKLSISLSPQLRERIEEYVKRKHEETPKDPRYKSISSFITHLTEKSLDIFDKNKTLDDFDDYVDKEYDDFIDEFNLNPGLYATTRLLLPLYEHSVKANRYNDLELEVLLNYLIQSRDFAFQNKWDVRDLRSVKRFNNRLKRYLFSNKMTRYYRLDIDTSREDKKPLFTYEHAGFNYNKNIGYENFKLNAANYGFFGGKIIDLIYSESDNYCRYDVIPTDLAYTKDLEIEKRFKLIRSNFKFLTNYCRIVKDEDYYLWMRLAKSDNFLVDFKNELIMKRWLNTVIQEFNTFDPTEQVSHNLLKLFENFHWISILGADMKRFKIDPVIQENEIKKNFLINILSNFAAVSQKNDEFILN